jgi:hypothetical protein
VASFAVHSGLPWNDNLQAATGGYTYLCLRQRVSRCEDWVQTDLARHLLRLLTWLRLSCHPVWWLCERQSQRAVENGILTDFS